MIKIHYATINSAYIIVFIIKVLVSSACLAELMLVKCKSISESICAPSVAHTVSAFLSRSTNSGVAKVTGSKVNRGGGYGLKIPCKYTFHGQKITQISSRLSVANKQL